MLNATDKDVTRKVARKAGGKAGRQAGSKETHQEWEAWNQLRLQAEANCEPFNEPPPSQWQTNLDSNGKNS